MGTEHKAVLRAAVRPTETQEQKIRQFLKTRYPGDTELIFRQDASLSQGFRLEVDSHIYDWTREGRIRQFEEMVRSLDTRPGEMVSMMKQALQDWSPSTDPEEIGQVMTVGDEIATVSGLPQAQYGEILIFCDGTRGMVQDLQPGRLGCILFGSSDGITEGSPVHRSHRTAGMPVGMGFLGRVVNALGSPVDGKGPIEAEHYRPVEFSAPEILDRQPVCAPLETGILAVDSMFPIGKGQRELIIGDRQTGKTAVALDTILNQKGKNVICIYAAIGQKASSTAQLVENLTRRGAMDYTVVLNASASASASLQYIAPYSACALGEYFMYQGRDVLIVYDDLSKHAIAYRTISLLLERSPGREAYPGDVFYLHSRLLERSAHLSEELGGGSMTALPIVETQAGDVSAYIPTNIISITDGQLFLESRLFFEGQRPAVNVGLSVSRVGGDAQTKAMKKASGAIRLDLAQYREMEVFTQFSSDLDQVTRKQLHYGQSLMKLLRQPQYRPFSQHQQVILLTAALHHLLDEVSDVLQFRDRLLKFAEEKEPELCRRIDETGILSPEDEQAILELTGTCLQNEGGR